MIETLSWGTIATVLSYALLAVLQILWWLDFRQWRRRMSEGIRNHRTALREAAAASEITRRADGNPHPPR